MTNIAEEILDGEDISWPSSPIGVVSCTAFVLCHRTGRAEEPEDISWPSSPIGVVSCTAFVLCHRTGRPEEPEDISWPSSLIGVVSCTVWRRRRRGRKEAEERRGGDRGKSYNHHTDGGEKQSFVRKGSFWDKNS